MNNIYDKIDKINDNVTEIKIVLAKQHVVLEEHIKRTLQNEVAIEGLFQELKPIKTHVGMVNLIFKILGIIVSLTTPILAILKLLGKI